MTTSRHAVRTTETVTNATRGRNAALVLSAAVIVAAALAVVFRAAGPDPAGGLPLAAEAAATVALSPAAALATDKPILLFFYPYEACQIRYCLQPAQVASQLREAVGDAVSFVPVVTHTVMSGDTGLESALAPENVSLPMENWDLWLLPPYDAWIPELQPTAAGLGLAQPTLVLVDREQRVRQRGSGTLEVFAAIPELVE